MILADIYCPPIPWSWQKSPRVVVDEEGRLRVFDHVEVKKEVVKSARPKGRKYPVNAARIAADERWNRVRRERRLLRTQTKYGKNQEAKRAEAVRTMVAMAE